MGNIDNNEFKKLENLYKLKEFSKLEKEVKRLSTSSTANIGMSFWYHLVVKYEN